MQKICIVSTVELPIVFFMLPHIKMLQQHYDLTIIVNTDNPHFLRPHGIEVKVIPVRIERKIRIIQDLKALFRLVLVFRKNDFQLIHSIAPKAGLLTMLAGAISKTPIRVHCFTGQVWANSSGMKRLFLKHIDQLTALCATHLLTDSHSQRDVLISEKIASSEKLAVLANGSVSGVDPNRFYVNSELREVIRKQLGISADTVLFLFLGRLTKDKGVMDLAEAFKRLLCDTHNTEILFVGPDEENLQDKIIKSINKHSNKVHFIGYTKTPEQYMMAADVLCLPSYREGFGMVTIEAAATGIPSIASNIYGISDAIIDKETGLLHTPGSISEIASCMSVMCKDVSTRNKLGRNARERAIKLFSQDILVKALKDFYYLLLHGKQSI